MAGRRQLPKLAAALLFAIACSSTPSSPTGLLSTPAGLTLAGTLMFISNEDSNELHLYDTEANEFIPAPAVLFPLSIPTVQRPYSLCSDTQQVFVASSVDPSIGVIDAIDDPTSHLPQSGLRELGQVTLPGVAQQVVCTQSPEAVLAHEIALGGSPAGYLSMLGAGQLVLDAPDGSLPSGSPDERHAFLDLPTAAITLLNAVGQPSELLRGPERHHRRLMPWLGSHRDLRGWRRARRLSRKLVLLPKAEPFVDPAAAAPRVRPGGAASGWRLRHGRQRPGDVQPRPAQR